MARFVLGMAALAAGFVAFDGLASQVVSDGTLTIDGEIVEIADETELGSVTNVVLTNEGGVLFTKGTDALTKNYSVDGTGVVEVAAGQTVRAGAKTRLHGNTIGQTLIKRGAGKLQFSNAVGVVNSKTLWLVEAGELYLNGGDFFGGHSSTTTNLTIDVRKFAVLSTDNNHCPMGPLVLTGSSMYRPGRALTEKWGDTAFRGGVVAHPSDRDSTIRGAFAHLNHVNTDVPFVVEQGATLNVCTRLANGYDGPSNNMIANKLLVSGGGHLRLFEENTYSGGTKVSDGTTVTIADAKAFGTGPLEIDGDVTLEVLPGVTFAGSVTGSGTLHKTGDGVAQFTSTAAGVTVDRTPGEGTMGEANAVDADGKLHLNGARVTVDVPSGKLEIKGFVNAAPDSESVRTEIVKTGAGTLVLPTGSAAKYGKLTVKGGFVEVPEESVFGSDGVSLQAGGGLRVTKTFTQARSLITCTGSVTLDVPAGVTFGIHSNYFATAGATVTKTGGGTWRPVSNFRTDKGYNSAGAKWIVHEGKLRLCSGDVFGGHTTACPLVLEAHEGATIELDSGNCHTPLCAVVLRGATMWGFGAQFSNDNNAKMEGGGVWHGFGLNGPVTVLPSNDGRPSRIFARACHLAHGTKATVFDVQAGATLEVDTLLNAGWNGACNARNYAGLVKTGGGTLKLLKQIGTEGTFDVQGGTVELGPKVALNSFLKLQVASTAKVVMNDGSQLATAVDATSALLGSADVWFDAARLNLADGASVSSVPNYGTAGGEFKNVVCLGNYTPTAPTYVANGIGGRGSLYFNGSQSLVTTAYTNFTSHVQVFLVSKWTSWANEGGKGKWGGPISLMAKSPSAGSDNWDDNNCAGALTYENWSGQITDLQTCTKGCTVAINPSGIAVNTPYITHSYMNKAKSTMFSEVWRTEGCAAKTNTAATSIYNCEIDTVCIGGRMRKGVPQIWGAGNSNNRQYIGQIGELLVFTRELTAAETAKVYAYLEKKWFGVGSYDKPTAKALASNLPVEVTEGASAHLVANLAVTETTAPTVEKTGAGTLRLGGTFEGEAYVDVAEGGLELKDGKLPSQVDIWVDASDSTGMTFDDNGRVTNLVNRGACGGAFVRNMRRNPAPTGPEWTANSINGLPALDFDGDSALALDTYVNRTSPRRVSVYCVGVRTFWELKPGVDNGGGHGKWAGPYSLGSTQAAASDEQVRGIVTVQEGAATQCWVDFGVGATANVTIPSNGEPYLMVFHNTTNGYFLAYETNKTDSAKIPRLMDDNINCEPFDIDIVQLGTRTTEYGKPQWWGREDNRNRSWYGKIGEFIVTTEPLSYEQELELYAYLRKKWLNKGSGSATPPTWLTGAPGTATLGEEVVLSMADGTSLRHEAGEVTLGALETEGTVDWTRIWSGDDVNDFSLFDVVGDVSLGNVNLTVDPVVRKADVKVLGYGGAALTTPTWRVLRPDGKLRPGSTVTDRGSGYWLWDQIGSLLLLK